MSHCLSELSEAIQSMEFNKASCHQRAVELFNAELMTLRYLAIYERIMSFEVLNSSSPMMQETATRLPWKT
jgi:hypothetical protein